MIKKRLLRVLCLYEAMGGASILSGRDVTEEDMLILMHAYTCVTRGVHNREVFESIVQRDEFRDDIENGVAKLLEELSQWASVLPTNGADDEKGGDAPTAREIVGLLVVGCRLPPSYVLDEMELWEASVYIGGLNHMHRRTLEEQRLFTYVGLMPHIDTRQGAVRPEDIITFPWEAGRSAGADFVENNYDALSKLLNSKEKV